MNPRRRTGLGYKDITASHFDAYGLREVAVKIPPERIDFKEHSCLLSRIPLLIGDLPVDKHPHAFNWVILFLER